MLSATGDHRARLRAECGPVGRLELAVDRVCCLGRGEPWHADRHWTLKEPTDRQRAMAEAMGIFTGDRRWTRGELAREIGEREDRGVKPEWSRVRPALMEAAFGSRPKKVRRGPRVDWRDEGGLDQHRVLAPF